jgi:hypothetical protein
MPAIYDMTRQGQEVLVEKKKLLGYTESKGLLGVTGSPKKSWRYLA